MSPESIAVPGQDLLDKHQIGGGDYKKIGADYLYFFKTLGQLSPADRVLDIGCGLGRMAAPLLGYLKPSWYRRLLSPSRPRYVGMDINSEAVDWCQKNISPLYSYARFQWMDVNSLLYNPKGKYTPDNYRFPFPDGSFDFIFLTSVFTHMRPAGVQNYLNEIKRLLVPGGRCFSTFFLINDTATQSIHDSGDLKIFLYGLKIDIHTFPCHLDGFYAEDPDVPEKVTAFDETAALSFFSNAGLSIVGDVHNGCWCGREQHVSYQDIIVAQKPGP